MKEVLQKQYALVCGSRELVVNFIEHQVGSDLNKPVTAYENKAIRHLLEHNAGCYFYWLAYYALQQPGEVLHNQELTTVDLVRHRYAQVNKLVALFLHNFEDKMETIIDGTYSGNGQERATPLQVFTHVLTHEFHHKGQIMFMCRMLGYAPPDTGINCSF